MKLAENYVALNETELMDIDGGLAITIFGVTLVLTAKGLAMGVAAVTAAYRAGKAIGQGLAHYHNRKK